MLAYELVTDQMVNLDTCTVAFSGDVDDLARESICQSLQMSAVDYHDKYLGLPICIYWLLVISMTVGVIIWSAGP